MSRQRPERSAAGSSFSWQGAAWTIIMAGGAYGLYSLQQYHVLNEQQLIFLIFVAAPLATFFLSGKGQDRSADQDSSAASKDELGGSSR